MGACTLRQAGPGLATGFCPRRSSKDGGCPGWWTVTRPDAVARGRFRNIEAGPLTAYRTSLPIRDSRRPRRPRCATRRPQERRRAWSSIWTSVVATGARWLVVFPGPPTGETARITVPARRNPEGRRMGGASLDYRARRDSAGALSGGNRGVRTKGAGRLAMRSLKAFCKPGLWSALRTCGICDAKRPAGSRLVDESCPGTPSGAPRRFDLALTRPAEAR